MSFGAMSLVSAGNTLLPHVLFNGNNAPAATNLGNVFYGIGAALTSFSIGMLFKKFGYSKTVAVLAGIFAFPVIFSLLAKYPEVKTGFKFSDSLHVLSHPVVLIAIVANFFASGAENGVGAWINTLMSRAGFSDKSANMFLSVFFICIMVSRLLSVPFVNPENATNAIAIMAIVAIITLVLMILVKSKAMVIAGVILLGLALGPNVPNIFGYMFSKIDQSIYGTSFGICFAAGVTGASIFPGLVGLFSKRLSLKRSFFIVNILGAALLFVVSFLIM
jgi:fucose permease